jgi:hypothetical protein
MMMMLMMMMMMLLQVNFSYASMSGKVRKQWWC